MTTKIIDGVGTGAARRDTLVMLGLALSPVVALGFSRFAYALLLPPMREALGWNYTQAGGMNTANAVGYVLGAATSAWWSKRFGSRAAFFGTLAASSLVLALTAAATDYGVLMVLRFIGGVTTAVAFVVGSSLAARVSRPRLPVYFAGVGVGIVISGLVVPAALAGSSPAAGWRVGWLLLGALSLVSLAPAWLATRATPRHQQAPAATLTLGECRKLGATFVGYVLFGAGYVSYMTFVIALLRAQEMPAWVTVSFWLILGTASALSSLFWGSVLARFEGGRGPAFVSAVVLVGVIPVLAYPSAVSALASGVLFGGSFMAGPAAITALCCRALPPAGWTAGIAAMTTAFALGQAAGPVISGFISDGAGGLTAGLWLSPILLALAAGVSLLQPRQEHGVPSARIVCEVREAS